MGKGKTTSGVRRRRTWLGSTHRVQMKTLLSSPGRGELARKRLTEGRV